MAVDWLKDGPERIRVLGPRARGRAGQPARRLPAVLDRHRSRVSLRPFDRRQRGLGSGPAHPDLWAGVIPIVADMRKVLHALLGERQPGAVLRAGRRAGRRQDGQERPRPRPLPDSAASTSRWSSTGAAGTRTFTTTSRTSSTGWTAGRRATSFPRSSPSSTMRTWDNFFWWFEAGKLPPRAIVDPNNWPPARGVSAGQDQRPSCCRPTACRSPPAPATVTVWLSPEVVDFSRDHDDHGQQQADQSKARQVSNPT